VLVVLVVIDPRRCSRSLFQVCVSFSACPIRCQCRGSPPCNSQTFNSEATTGCAYHRRGSYIGCDTCAHASHHYSSSTNFVHTSTAVQLLQREIGTASKAVGRDTLPTLVAQLLLEVNRVPAADEVGDDEDFVAPIRPQQRRRWMHWHRRQHVTNVLKKHNWQTEYFDFPHVYAELSSESEPGLDGDKLS